MRISIQPLSLLVSLLLLGCRCRTSLAAAAGQDSGPSGHKTCAPSGIFADTDCEDEDHHIHLIQTNLVLSGDRPPAESHRNSATKTSAASHQLSMEKLIEVLGQIRKDDPEDFDVLLGRWKEHPFFAKVCAESSLQEGEFRNDTKAPEIIQAGDGGEITESTGEIVRNTTAETEKNITETAQDIISKVNWDKVARQLGYTNKTAARKDLEKQLEKREKKIARDVVRDHIRSKAAEAGPFDPLQGIWMLMNLDEAKCDYRYFLAVFGTYILACIFWEYKFPTLPSTADYGGNRNEGWDFAKFVFVGFVVHMHTLVILARLFGEHSMYEMWTGLWVALPFGIAPIIFITGVFSSSLVKSDGISIRKRTLFTTLFGLPCTQLLFSLAMNFETYVTPGFTVFSIGRSGVEWYLECMFAWRLGIAPIFHFARKYRVPFWLVFMSFYIGSWLVWYSFPYNPHTWYAFAAPLKDMFPWRLCVMFAPYFALGLLKSVEDWNALFSSPFLFRISVMAYIAYVVLILNSSGFRESWDTACTIPGQCRAVWWPQSVAGDLGVNLHSLKIYTWVFVQRVLSIIVATSVCFGAVRIMKQRIPRVAALLTTFGARTFYSYLLHWLLWIMPASRLGLALWVSSHFLVPLPPPGWRYAIFWTTGFIVHITLSSRLTEVLFQWLFLVPVWFARCFGFKFDGMKEDTDKPVAQSAGALLEDTTATVKGSKPA